MLARSVLQVNVYLLYEQFERGQRVSKRDLNAEEGGANDPTLAQTARIGHPRRLAPSKRAAASHYAKIWFAVSRSVLQR